MSNIILSTGSTFRIRRPASVSNGFVNDLDPRVQEQLDTLHALLSADVFSRAAIAPAVNGAPNAKEARASASGLRGLDPAMVLESHLTPQRAVGTKKWADKSLAAVLDAEVRRLTDGGELDPNGQSSSSELISLAEYVDRVSDLSTLKYSVDDALAAEWTIYPEPVRRALDPDAYPALRVYLVAYAYLVLQLRDTGAVKKFLLNDSLGAQALVDYATVGAARALVADRGFSISGFDDDNGTFVNKIRVADVGLSTASFEPDVMSVVNDLINDVEHKDLIDEAEKTLGPLPLSTRLMLARYIDAAPVKITKTNVGAFAAIWLAQNAPPLPSSSADVSGLTDADFGIETYQDDPSSMQISRSAVLCAAQLYYVMVLGDELDVFGIVHYFTHKYLVSGQMEIVDPVLRQDLQNYVFSNRFTDMKTGRLVDLSRREERQMFEAQVFGAPHHRHKHLRLPDDLILNDDYPSLWKVLMLQSATYLEKAQASLNPDAFVSRQQVMQAVEDLQYNLSTHCIGMATVATPLMHSELAFVIKRILMHPEVLKQVVPVGGTWWRVVERLYMEIKQTRPRSTAIYNKAKLGHDIIAAIADYNPATFEDDASFSDFISSVDAYITTQSILQQALTDDLKRRQEDSTPTVRVHDDDDDRPPAGEAPPAPDASAAPSLPPTAQLVPAGASANGASRNGHRPSDEWDF